jgi:protein-tyrosine-phosphatase
MTHILFICTANICRSPVAEALLNDRLKKNGYDDWTVGSAGTWALSRGPAAQNSQIVSAQYGLDISDHVSRMVNEAHLKEADLILCMEEGHVEALKVEFPDQAHKIYPLTAMIGPIYNVNDPFGGPLVDYQIMIAELARIIDGGFDRIIELAEENNAINK